MIPAFSFAVTAEENLPSKKINIQFDKSWKTLGFKKNKRSEFSVSTDGLSVLSEQAVAFYHYKLPRLSQMSHCNWHLSFQWRVLSANNMTPQKLATKDDRPLAVHLWISDPSQYGWFKGNLARLFSVPAPGYMLSYSWGINEEWGQTFPNPHLTEKAYIQVLRKQSDIGTSWFSEKIEASKDIDTFFNPEQRKKPIYFVISSDTEDSGGNASAEIKDVSLHIEECNDE